MSDFTETYKNRLKSKLFGLLCEYEKKGEWEKFLDNILTELLGVREEHRTSNYYTLFHKISSLKYLRYDYFRSTIFSCMDILGKTHELF